MTGRAVLSRSAARPSGNLKSAKNFDPIASTHSMLRSYSAAALSLSSKSVMQESHRTGYGRLLDRVCTTPCRGPITPPHIAHVASYSFLITTVTPPTGSNGAPAPVSIVALPTDRHAASTTSAGPDATASCHGRLNQVHLMARLPGE